MNKLIIFLYTILIHLSAQTEEANYFIAKDLSGFEILNRYQQKISAAEKSRFAENTPWTVLERRTLLGDQITHTMQVQHEGVTFYFILNTDGTFKGDPQTFHEIFENCIIVNDHITVTLDKGVLFRTVPFSAKSNEPKIYLDRDIQLKRLFKKGPSYFIKNIQTGRYGWIRFSNNSAIKIITKEKQTEQVGFSDQLTSQVERKIAKINAVYDNLFKYLNSEYHQNRSVPVWEIRRDENNIILSLQNVKPEKLHRSTSYLVNDIENIFVGEPVFISTTTSSIVISLSDET